MVGQTITNFHLSKMGEFLVWCSGNKSDLGSMRLWVWSLASLSVLGIQRCCELWCRQAAVGLIRPLAWELPYATGVALKRKKKKKKTLPFSPSCKRHKQSFKFRGINQLIAEFRKEDNLNIWLEDGWKENPQRCKVEITRNRMTDTRPA